MATEGVGNRVRTYRLARQWSQLELAQRANISRAAVSAIESAKLIPSVSAALSLARTLECTVEELFGDLQGSEEARTREPLWAWSASTAQTRYWAARIGARRVLFPAEPTPLGVMACDGRTDGRTDGRADGRAPLINESLADMTLVVACCDPAISLLARLYEQTTGFRLLAFCRSSQVSLELLQRNRVHLAGVHLSTASRPEENRVMSRAACGEETRLIRVATWEEGLALGSQADGETVARLLRADRRWVGREAGSGARHCQDELWTGRQGPEQVARDHRSVAEAILGGWADVGVCLRLVAEESGLGFLSVRSEHYDLCYLAEHEQDPRISAFVRVVQSVACRRLISELPGYDTASTGLLS